MSSLAALVVVASSVLGQAAAQEEAATPESLSDDYIVGTWMMEGEIEGNPLKGAMRVRPGANGMCLIYEQRFKVKGMDAPLQATAIGGLDTQANRYREYCFNSMGDDWINSYSAEDFADTGMVHGERIGTIKGKPYKGKITVERKGKGEFVYSVQSEDGMNMKYIFHRAKEGHVKSEATKEHLKQLGDILTGKWITESTTEVAIEGICDVGDKYIVTTSCEWVSDQTVLLEKRVYEINDKVVADGAALIGWDAPKAQIQSTSFGSLGGFWTTVYTMTESGFTTRNSGTFADGRTSSGRTDTTISQDGKTLTAEVMGRIVAGKRVDDKVVVTRRVEE